VKKILIYSLITVFTFSMLLIGTSCDKAGEAEEEVTEAVTEAVVEEVEEEEEEEEEEEPVKFTFWHIQTVAEQALLWHDLADEFMAEKPYVNVDITGYENENFKAKLTTVMQGGEPPDMFQSWGGGTMIEYAEAGLLRDITSFMEEDNWASDTFTTGLSAFKYQDNYYGVPRDMGIVGFWYNTDLFNQAGADIPTTWAELLATCQTLKDAGITPIAIGEGDKWPGAFYWEYLATRIAGEEGFNAAYSRTGSFADESFVEAGEALADLVAINPFQSGFLSALWEADASVAFANGDAAMILQGQWGAGQFESVNADIMDKLGWFPFPEVEGGAGGPYDAIGGGNGFVIGKDAPDEAVEFLKYISSVDSQIKQVELGMAMPVVKGAEVAIEKETDKLIAEGLSKAEYYQLYYDQFFPGAVGSVINDSIQGIFAGTLTPEQCAQAIEDAVAQEMD